MAKKEVKKSVASRNTYSHSSKDKGHSAKHAKSLSSKAGVKPAAKGKSSASGKVTVKAGKKLGTAKPMDTKMDSRPAKKDGKKDHLKKAAVMLAAKKTPGGKTLDIKFDVKKDQKAHQQKSQQQNQHKTQQKQEKFGKKLAQKSGEAKPGLKKDHKESFVGSIESSSRKMDSTKQVEFDSGDKGAAELKGRGAAKSDRADKAGKGIDVEEKSVAGKGRKAVGKGAKKAEETELDDVGFLADETGDDEIGEYADELKAVEELDAETEDLDSWSQEAKDKEDQEIILTDAEGRRYCRSRDCDQIAVVDGYCRFHYLLFWKKIQIRKKILADGKLQRYVEELTARYPDKFLELIRRDLRTEKDFLSAIQEMEIDEGSIENDFEEDSSSFIDEVRTMGEPTGSTMDEDDY